ncbi:hypothetical protein TKK_0005350 [Trichogramma kaykai]
MSRSGVKRNMPSLLVKTLSLDVYLTDQFVKSMEKVLDIKKYKTHYRALEYSCHGLIWIPLWIGFIWILNSKSLYQMQINFFIGLILDVLAVAIIKAISRRRRPVKTEDAIEIGPDKFSFPSGHASRAFYIFFFFLFNWPIHFIFVPFLATWAVCVTVSRVMMRRHHLLDIAAGVVLGLITSFFIGLIYLEESTCTDLVWWLTDEKLDGGEYHV